MHRREALKSLLLAPLAEAGVQAAVEIPADCRLLILNFDVNCHLEHETTLRTVRDVLTKAGMAHVEVILSQGLESVGAVK